MRNLLLVSAFLACSVALFGQKKMFIHKSDKVTVEATVSETDSVYFTDYGAKVYFSIGSNILKYWVTEIDSITFGEYVTNTVYIIYNDDASVTVINPLEEEGVAVAVNGTDVVVTSTSTTRDINYNISGTTTDGSLKMYGDKRYNLILNGANITNAEGPAINLQSNNKVFVTLMDGTSNSLSDAGSYADSATTTLGEVEDQKAAFFSEGQMIFIGTGSLGIRSNATDKHALCSDEYIEIDNGSITVTNAGKDGIHGKEGVVISGGTVNVSSTSGDGIDGVGGGVAITRGNVTITNSSEDASGITSDTTIVISGGTVNITVSGNQSKGITCDQVLSIEGGSITINTSGSANLVASGSGYNPSYCTALKSDSIINISGSKLTITCTGKGGKGISSDQDVIMTGGNVQVTCSGAGATYTNESGTADAYFSTCVKADGNISITGGTLTASNSGSAGRGITCDGSLTIGSGSGSPVVNVTTTGSAISISGSNTTTQGGRPGQSSSQSSGESAKAKAMKSVGAFTMNSGSLTISSADDGVKSEASITINGGTATVSQSYEAFEAPYITINGGTTNLTASNDGINATLGTVSGGTESNDGALFKVTGGTIVVAGADAIDSNGNVEISGGTVLVNQLANSLTGVEEGVDFNGTFNVSGGTLMSCGGSSSMSKAMSTTSTQYGLYLSTNSIVSAGTFLHIQDASGTDIITYKVVNGGYKFLVSSSSLKSGSSYTIYSGGSYSGGTSNNGLYTGGTYSGGTSKKTFSVSSIVTTVSL